MATFVVPSELEDRYFKYDEFYFGPFDQSKAMKGEMIPFRSTLESIEQGSKKYGENDVVHSKLEGDIRYHPFKGGLVLVPTLASPRATRFPALDNLNKPVFGNSMYGIAIHKGSSFRYADSTKQQILHIAWEQIDAFKWRYFQIWAFANNPTRITNMYERIIYPKSIVSGVSWYLTLETRTYSTGQNGVSTDIDWRLSQEYKTIRNQFVTTPGSWTKQDVLGVMVRGDFDRKFTLASAREQIDSLVANLFPDEFPIKDKHFGDLAMEASQTVQANQVNMISFLRDLRKPQELIPKLRNLRNLKGVSGEYLGVQYGILPTISDIQGIIEAFKRMKPYLDKNGFKVYTAGYHEELTQNLLNFELTQRIKLAIEDEDDGFQKLIQRLEDMGTLPTLVNVWDLVPYSFVVDWFIDVGGLLERVDSHLRLLRLNIRYVTMSRKTKVTGTLPVDVGTTFVGSIDWVHYHRWTSDQCPVPPLSLETTFQDFNHWLESGALLAQRTKG